MRKTSPLILPLFLLTLTAAAPAPEQRGCGLGGGAGDDHARRLGHRSRARAYRRRRGVRDDLCAGGGRFSPDRGELPDGARTHRRGRWRQGDLAGFAGAALRQRDRAQGRLLEEPAIDAAADGCVGGRAELFPGDTPAGEAARADALRALDGDELHRRQHRRRHRADRFEEAGSVLFSLAASC